MSQGVTKSVLKGVSRVNGYIESDFLGVSRFFFLGCERVFSVFVLGLSLRYIFPVCLNKNIIFSFEQFII